MAQSGGVTRLLDQLEEHAAEAVAVVASLVLLLGVVAVASESESTEELAGRAPAPSSTPAPPAPALVLPDLDVAPPAATSTPSVAAPSAPAVDVPASAGPADRAGGSQTQGDSGSRVVVLGVDAPSTVAAGETVTFRVSVRGTGGTPVLTGARFGDGATGGTAAPCAGLAGPSFRGVLQISHTYTAAGTYQPYFVASLPCGPSSGAGTTVTVTGPREPVTSPTSTPPAPATPSPTASPTTSPTTSPASPGPSVSPVPQPSA